MPNRKTKATPPAAVTTSESVLDLSLEALHYGLTALRGEIEKIETGKAKANGHDKGSRIAFLTMRVGAIADSVRKLESARAKRLENLTPALVMAWFRELDVTERAKFLRELQTVDSKRSGLG